MPAAERQHVYPPEGLPSRMPAKLAGPPQHAASCRLTDGLWHCGLCLRRRWAGSNG